jgi:hypothetical protein
MMLEKGENTENSEPDNVYIVSEAYKSEFDTQEDKQADLNKETQTIRVEDTYEDRFDINTLSTRNIMTGKGLRPIRDISSAKRPQTALSNKVQSKRYTESIKELQLSHIPSDKISELEESDSHSRSNGIKSRVGSGRPQSRQHGGLYQLPAKAKKPIKIGEAIRDTSSKFDDAVIINYIPNIRNNFTSRYEEITLTNNNRPQTSKYMTNSFRPVSALHNTGIRETSVRETTVNNKNPYKESSVNNLYFNQYIDIQFDKIGLLNALQKKKENVILF